MFSVATFSSSEDEEEYTELNAARRELRQQSNIFAFPDSKFEAKRATTTSVMCSTDNDNPTDPSKIAAHFGREFAKHFSDDHYQTLCTTAKNSSISTAAIGKKKDSRLMDETITVI